MMLVTLNNFHYTLLVCKGFIKCITYLDSLIYYIFFGLKLKSKFLFCIFHLLTRIVMDRTKNMYKKVSVCEFELFKILYLRKFKLTS